MTTQIPSSSLIVAIATPPGRGGVAILRLSGPADSRFCALAKAIFGRSLEQLLPRMAHHVRFLDSDGTVIDDGIALYFAAPASFTGESVLELQGHGSPVVMQSLVRRCIALGAQHAEPGEFTKRAFINGKLDLTQAEAVADVIDAATESAAKAAVRSLTGEFSTRIKTLQDQLIRLRMFVEATLDFPEEEVDFLEAERAREQLGTVRTALLAVVHAAGRGQMLRDGIRIVLAGAPNVGKSSLLNALTGDEVAIVTPIAGTTRDTVRSRVSIKGLPAEVIDTAGLRKTEDPVEAIGIERTRSAIRDADLALLLIESGQADAVLALAALTNELPTAMRRIVVHNKSDLLSDNPKLLPIAINTVDTVQQCWVSAKTGEGIDSLLDTIANTVGFDYREDDGFIARERHLSALHAALSHLDQAAFHLDHIVLELFAEELRLAHEALGTVLGEFSADDLLGAIFSRFCIGK